MNRVLEFADESDAAENRLDRCVLPDTERLAIRALTADDAAEFLRVCDDPLIAETIPFIPKMFDLEEARSMLVGADGHKDCFFGVWLRVTTKLIGVVGTHLSAGRDVEVGYWFHPEFHGQGYASEAVGTIVERLNTSLPRRQIVAQCRPENTPSWRLLEKLGFKDQGSEGARDGRHFLIRQI